jgi:monothiol glutaredoxin
VNGELVGGSDILLEMFESGELAQLLGAEQPQATEVEEEQPQKRPIGLENRLG